VSRAYDRGPAVVRHTAVLVIILGSYFMIVLDIFAFGGLLCPHKNLD
jgi:hypothetical protein